MMGSWDLRGMSPEVYAEHLQRDADNVISHPADPMYFLYEANGHSEQHKCQSIETMMQRLFHNEIGFVSSFFDDKAAHVNIADTISFCADDIADWFYTGKTSDKPFISPQSSYHRLVLTLNMGGDEPIGFGFDQGLQEYTTTAINVVLDRDRSGTAPYGFSLVTAFPDLANENYRTPTGTRYMIEEVASSSPGFADNMDRLAALYRRREGHFKVYYSPGTEHYPPATVLKQYAENCNIEVFLYRDSYTIRQRLPRSSRRMTFGELLLSHPDLARVLKEMVEDRDRLERGETIPVDKTRFHNKDKPILDHSFER